MSKQLLWKCVGWYRPVDVEACFSWSELGGGEGGVS